MERPASVPDRGPSGTTGRTTGDRQRRGGCGARKGQRALPGRGRGRGQSLNAVAGKTNTWSYRQSIQHKGGPVTAERQLASATLKTSHGAAPPPRSQKPPRDFKRSRQHPTHAAERAPRTSIHPVQGLTPRGCQQRRDVSGRKAARRRGGRGERLGRAPAPRHQVRDRGTTRTRPHRWTPAGHGETLPGLRGGRRGPRHPRESLEEAFSPGTGGPHPSAPVWPCRALSDAKVVGVRGICGIGKRWRGKGSRAFAAGTEACRLRLTSLPHPCFCAPFSTVSTLHLCSGGTEYCSSNRRPGKVAPIFLSTGARFGETQGLAGTRRARTLENDGTRGACGLCQKEGVRTVGRPAGIPTYNRSLAPIRKYAIRATHPVPHRGRLHVAPTERWWIRTANLLASSRSPSVLIYIVKCLPVTEPENGRVICGALESDQEYSSGPVVWFESPDITSSPFSPAYLHCALTVTSLCETGTVYQNLPCSDPQCPPISPRVTCNPPYIADGFYTPQRIIHRSEDKISYRKDGFYPATRGNMALCTSSGWSPTPRCSLKPCDFPEIKNGYLHQEDYYRSNFPVDIGKYYYYYCNRGFVTPLQQSGGYIKCTREGWSPDAPCLKRCYLYHVENGYSHYSRRHHLEGHFVGVQCNPGYSLQNGHSTIACTELDDWSPPRKCIRVKACSKSDIKIQNGFISESKYMYPINYQTQYTCKPGYVTAEGKISGSIRCLESGWSTQPICIKSCDIPFFENARPKSDGTWFKLNDKLDYECRAGYENTGGSTTGSIVCGHDGWSDTPMCYERECGVPDIPPNLHASPRKDKYKIGDVLHFSCRQRSKRVGPDSIQCYHFGWSPNPPTCKGQVKSCGPPPQLLNGDIKGSKKEKYGHSEVVEYVCNPRFLMKGSKKIQCVDGDWTTLPICVEEESTCGDVPILEHGYSLSSDPPYHHGHSVEFSCRESFTMIGYRSITCVKGMWTQLPQCTATEQLQKCKLSRILGSNLRLSNQTKFNHNTNFSYRCRGKSEYKQSTCINGRWDPKLTCTEKRKQLCPPPPHIPNTRDMTTTLNYQDGEKISILCQENYLIQEAKEIVCKDGRWQSIPRCVGNIPCSPPPHIKHAIINLSRFSEVRKATSKPRLYSHGRKLTCICEDGFSLSEELTCHMGKWSSPPQCIVKNANIISKQMTRYPPGERVLFECNKPYSLYGEVEAMCLSGTWTEAPQCKNSKGKCGPPPPIENGDITSFPLPTYAQGSSVEYQCQNLYKLQGNKHITCRNGSWSKPPKCLDACVVSEEMMEKYNIQLKLKNDKKTYVKTNDTIEFTCKLGYREKTPRETFQATCQEGKLEYPSCETYFG
ncbi:LOW QUALITY PROTEIN: complement factor H-like [Dugong dugon]